jgi:hypothetical protein
MKSVMAFVALCFILCVPIYAQNNNFGAITAASADCSTAGSCVTLTIPSTASSAVITISPTYSGTMQFEVTGDGSNWVAWLMYPYSGAAAVTSTTSTGTWATAVSGLIKIRVRCSAYTSGSAGIFINTGSGAYGFGSSSSGGSGGGAATIADGADVTQGAKADARSTATDTTAITLMQALKEISYMAQNPAAQSANQGTAAAATGAWPIYVPDPVTGSPMFTATQPGITGPVVPDSAIDSALNTGENPVLAGGVHQTTRTTVEDGDKAGFHFTPTQELIGSTPTPQTSGGLDLPTRILSAANANLTAIKGSAGQVYGWYITNTNAAARYVKLYNKATAPDPSACSSNSDCAVMTLLIPGGSTAGAGTSTQFGPGIAFTTGIGLAIVTGVADTDETGVAANEIIVHLFWK